MLLHCFWHCQPRLLYRHPAVDHIEFIGQGLLANCLELAFAIRSGIKKGHSNTDAHSTPCNHINHAYVGGHEVEQRMNCICRAVCLNSILFYSFKFRQQLEVMALQQALSEEAGTSAEE